MKYLRIFLMNLLGFSRSQANGAVILILLLILFALVPKIFFYYYRQQSPSLFEPDSQLQSIVDHIHQIESESDQLIKSERKSRMESQMESRKRSVRFFPFNPNSTSREKFLELGISEVAISNLEKYLSKGGRFQIKSDLSKVYGISEDQVKALWSYIDLPETVMEPKKKSVDLGSPQVILMRPSINEATSLEFQKVRGIGTKYSERIVKYRDLLGGFVFPEQLQEVYGLDSLLVDQLMIAFKTDSLVPYRHISINTDSIDHLARHPYLDYKRAAVILNYRRMHGPFQDLVDLKNIKIISDSLYQKIYPYLSLNP